MLWNGDAQRFMDSFAGAGVGDEKALAESLGSIPDAAWRTVWPRIEEWLHNEKMSRLRTSRPFFAARDGSEELVSIETKERLLMMERLRRGATPMRNALRSVLPSDGVWATVSTEWPWRS